MTSAMDSKLYQLLCLLSIICTCAALSCFSCHESSVFLVNETRKPGGCHDEFKPIGTLDVAGSGGIQLVECEDKHTACLKSVSEETHYGEYHFKENPDGDYQLDGKTGEVILAATKVVVVTTRQCAAYHEDYRKGDECHDSHSGGQGQTHYCMCHTDGCNSANVHQMSGLLAVLLLVLTFFIQNH